MSQTDIILLLRRKNRRMTTRQICDNLDCSIPAIQSSLRKLVKSRMVVRYGVRGTHTYYYEYAVK